VSFAVVSLLILAVASASVSLERNWEPTEVSFDDRFLATGPSPGTTTTVASTTSITGVNTTLFGAALQNATLAMTIKAGMAQVLAGGLVAQGVTAADITITAFYICPNSADARCAAKGFVRRLAASTTPTLIVEYSINVATASKASVDTQLAAPSFSTAVAAGSVAVVTPVYVAAGLPAPTTATIGVTTAVTPAAPVAPAPGMDDKDSKLSGGVVLLIALLAIVASVGVGFGIWKKFMKKPEGVQDKGVEMAEGDAY
jgi:hypothetical protein